MMNGGILSAVFTGLEERSRGEKYPSRRSRSRARGPTLDRTSRSHDDIGHQAKQGHVIVHRSRDALPDVPRRRPKVHKGRAAACRVAETGLLRAFEFHGLFACPRSVSKIAAR